MFNIRCLLKKRQAIGCKLNKNLRKGDVMLGKRGKMKKKLNILQLSMQKNKCKYLNLVVTKVFHFRFRLIVYK